MGDEQGPDRSDLGLGPSAADYDLHSWAASLGVATDVLRAVIAEVGDSAVAVRQRLRRDARAASAGAAAARSAEPPALE